MKTIVALSAVLASVILLPADAIEPAPADLALMHGRVITVDARDRVASAIAVRGGRILQVGSDRSIQALVGPATRVIDLHGRAVTPGLIDAHAHVMNGALAALFEVQLSDSQRLQDVLDRVAERAKTARAGEWILGGGWDESKLAERRYPTAADLDRVAPDNPVWLENVSGHFGVANSVALKLAGISASSPDPKAGLIERGVDGQPTGVLKEAAQDALGEVIPPYSTDQRHQAMKHALMLLHSEGMTGFKDPDITQDDWVAYRSLAADAQLDEYVCVLFHTPATLEGAKATLESIRAAQHDVIALNPTTLGVCGPKIYMDGSGVGRTAWMYQDWNRGTTEVDVGNHGFPALDPELYRQQVQLFLDAGVSVGTHAIGDHAIDWVADTYARVLRSHPKLGLRLAIIHANTPTDHAIAVMADLQQQFDSGIPETQAEFLWGVGDAYEGNLGPLRAQRLIPLHTYLDKAMIWAGGSDYDVTPLPARYGLWASIARQTSSGRMPFGTMQSVDIHAALRSYTSWAARQLFLEKQTGSLEPGKSADLAIWDRDPYSVPTDRLKDMVCEMTLFRGKLVYERTQD
jgi:hypothetical protein